ncbi:MAG: hypothetical protein GY832_35445 [Chloroflexi bacterium]|nr:hypothetical protein [Chloroflexota bacterium]
MSKSKKKRKQKRSTSSFSPLALLRPRLDGLLGNEALAKKDSQAIQADLNVVCKGLKPSEFLPVLLSACDGAPAQVQSRLDVVVPEWLGERGYLDSLRTLLDQRRITDEDQQRAVAWLEDAGTDVSQLKERQVQSSFYRAYIYTDDSQGVIVVLWYANHRRRKVQGMCLLIDFNPPWEGAAKDNMILPRRSPERAVEEFVGMWTQRGMYLDPLEAAEVKREILKSLDANRQEGIRLPRDLVRIRGPFVKHVLSLPDMPGTPSFTDDDFAELSRTGKSVESLRRFEQTVGRRVRLSDGEEAIVVGSPFDDDEW